MNLQTIYFAGGCFWCVEAVMERLEGVLDAVSGYMGGDLPDPDYEAVCSGRTGHAEVVRIDFDSERVSLESLLDLFWRSHDPTTLNRQGPDTGSQYRSAIFVTSPAQRGIATASIVEAQQHFPSPIVTTVEDGGTFYPAEDSHQNYFRRNPGAGYCVFAIAPKLAKLDATT